MTNKRPPLSPAPFSSDLAASLAHAWQLLGRGTVDRRSAFHTPTVATVELDGAPFKKFTAVRDAWAVEDSYISPGPIQFAGPTADDTNFTRSIFTSADNVFFDILLGIQCDSFNE